MNRVLEQRVAWDYAQTRAGWTSYRAGAHRLLVAGLTCLVLVIGGSYLIIARANAQLPEEPARIPGAGPVLVLLALLALGLIPIGIGALVRARRWGTALQQEPWTAAWLRIQGTDLVLRPALGEEFRARLMSTNRWRVKTVLSLDGLELWMLPVGPREILLTADGTDSVYGARRC